VPLLLAASASQRGHNFSEIRGADSEGMGVQRIGCANQSPPGWPWAFVVSATKVENAPIIWEIDLTEPGEKFRMQNHIILQNQNSVRFLQ